LLLDAPPKSPPPPLGADALFEAARVHQRRRRRGIVVALLLVSAAGVAAFLVLDRSAGQAVVHVPNGPVVNVRALAGHGRLALVSRGSLYVVSGTRVRRLPRPPGYFVPQDPQLSTDGEWLAYLEASPNGVTPSTLWLARGDGTGAREVVIPTPAQIVGWHNDTLAVLAGPQRKKQPCPCFSSTTIRLVSPDGTSRVIARAPWIYGAAWSPDGTAIGYGDDDTTTNRIASVPTTGGTPTVWWAQPKVVLRVAGWWKHGIGFWSFPFGSVHNNDSTPLSLVARPGALPKQIGETLSSGATDVLSASPSGMLAIQQAAWNPGRNAWTGKTLAVCGVTRCTSDSVAGTIKVDPAWSPDGRTLLFAYAPDFGEGPWSMKRLEAWFARHRAQLYDPKTATTRALPAANGGTAFVWAPDGKSLLFVKNDALWLLPRLDAKAVRIAGQIYAAGRWPQYYAQVDWAHQFSWAD
jgi:hypothetical protein